jgi:hypothetical protein
LKDSTNLWIFGDTFLVEVDNNRLRDSIKMMLNNTVVTQKNNSFKTLYARTPEKPESFLKPPETSWWYWTGHG